MDAYQPRPEHRFTFGLWTVGNIGRDPFGGPVRPVLDPLNAVRHLARLGAYGVSLHDDDLVPPGTGASDRDRIVREFRRVLDGEGMRVPMATVNLFSEPGFRDGALTSRFPSVRSRALVKAKAAMDLGVELGAEIFVLWGGREGTDTDAAANPGLALQRYRDGVNTLTRYIRDQRYPLKIALEAKPNEPRGDLFLPTTGAMLAFIGTLDEPALVGVNPEIAHEKMAGLNPAHTIAQALDAGKLVHVDLNDQRIGRFDQDLRFGSDDIKGAFFVVKALEEGGYQGPRNFDAHAYRTEDEEGVWAFARGCMRTYLVLKEKVARMREDPEIRGLLAAVERDDSPEVTPLTMRDEELDQLVVELLLGVR